MAGRPPSTPEENEQDMIMLSMNLARRQLEDGTASAQVITHFLKLGSSREALEQTRLSGENDLTRAKADQIRSNRNAEALFGEALAAMRKYSGEDDSESDLEEPE